jgi:hypothetical protein
VYSICVRFTGGDGRAHRERRRAVRRGAFSTRRNFLPTHIRDRGQCRGLGRAPESVLAAVVAPGLAEAPIVERARHAMTRRAPALAARVAAIPMAAVVPAADHEHADAPAAHQLVDGDAGVQGSGCDRQKFGGSPSPWDEWFVERPALGLRPKARACDSSLHSFRCAAIIPASQLAGHFPPRWSPGHR